jgi:hypothetical protein
MALDPKSDTWVPACDLCGSFRFETIMLGSGAEARRCRDCGLVRIPHGNGHRAGGYAAVRIPEELLLEAISHNREDGTRSALVIGTPSTGLVEAASNAGLDLTALVEPGHGIIPGVSTHEASFDAAGFVPDKFDIILCTRGLETFVSPSLLFDRARYWLAPGGSLLVGALNFDSLPARLRRHNWLQRYAMGAEHLLSLSTLKGYARRFGFDIKSVRNRSRTEDVASIITGSEHPFWITEMAVAPLALAASLFSMGVIVVIEMRKSGLALRPILRGVEEEVEGAPGLAPAMYTGVHRDSVGAELATPS